MNIHKILPNEKLLQVHYYQFFNSCPFELYYAIDTKGLNEKYPGFLQTFDFTNVDVYDLCEFIRSEERWTDWPLNTPEQLFCFWDKNIDDIFNIQEIEKFPLLFTDYNTSPFNDLVEVNYYDAISIFNQNGGYLNIFHFPNLIDKGSVHLTFLNDEYFVVEIFDDNNGPEMILYNKINGVIIEQGLVDSLELIELLDKNKIAWQIKDLSEKLKNNKSIMLASLDLWSHNFIEVNSIFKKDKEIVLKAVNVNGDNLKFADESFKTNREVVLAAVKSRGPALEYVNESLKADKEVALVAVKSDGRALEYTNESLKADKEVVLAAVKSHGDALEYASESLKADKEVVLAAVIKSIGGWALKYANESLKADKKFVLAAVKLNGIALQHASEPLKADKEVVLEAVNSNGFALKYANESLKAYKEVLKVAKENGYEDLPF